MRIAPHALAATRSAWNAAQNAMLGYPRPAVPLGGGRHVVPPPTSMFDGEVEDPDAPHMLAVLVDDRITPKAVTDAVGLPEQHRAALLAMLTVAKEATSALTAVESKGQGKNEPF